MIEGQAWQLEAQSNLNLGVPHGHALRFVPGLMEPHMIGEINHTLRISASEFTASLGYSYCFDETP